MERLSSDMIYEVCTYLSPLDIRNFISSYTLFHPLIEKRRFRKIIKEKVKSDVVACITDLLINHNTDKFFDVQWTKDRKTYEFRRLIENTYKFGLASKPITSAGQILIGDDAYHFLYDIIAHNNVQIFLYTYDRDDVVQKFFKDKPNLLDPINTSGLILFYKTEYIERIVKTFSKISSP